MVREEHFRFASSEGTIKCHGVRWIPEGEVKGIMQLVHGMSEYIERYRAFAMYLAEKGILVTGHDHLGHGETAVSEADYGYFAEKDGDRLLVEDIHRVRILTKKKWKNVPYVLFGHSMGSFLVRQYLCVHGEGLDGAVICGTGFQPRMIPELGKLICKGQAKRYDWHYRSNLLYQMSFGSYNQRFQPNRTDSDWLCRDEAVVDRYEADPKCGFPFTLNGYYNLFSCLSRITQKKYLEKMPKELPVLFIAGEEDPVGSFGKGVRKVENMFRQCGMQKVECKLYPEDRHEILNELDRENVYADVFDWLNRKIFSEK